MMRIHKALNPKWRCPEVKYMQETLGGLVCDGQYGPKTVQAVKDFQSKEGLVVDGKAGKNTLTALGIWTETVMGIDVAHYQSDRGRIDWQKVKEDGVRFAYIKVSEGSTWVDTAAKQNIEGAVAAGIPWGPYHFARGGDVVREIQNLERGMEGHVPDLPIALDVEGPFPLTGNDGTQWLDAWMDTAEGLAPEGAIFYTSSRHMAGKNLGTCLATKYPVLWVPRYSNTQPQTAPWTTWTIWQYSDVGRIDGIQGPVDLNRLVVADFKAFAA